MLWFLGAYVVFDYIGVGKTPVDPANKAVEDIVAAFGNENSADFTRDLSGVLPRAQSMIGTIDTVQRLPDGRLRLAGWVVDKAEAERPVSIFLIIPTKAVLMASTSKKRDDVAAALKLPKESMSAGFDEVFQYIFDCKSDGPSPFVVAVNQKGQFSVINTGVLVSGC